jgi:acetyltransferase-like isoleucine patch superfamily enzyme
MRIRLTQDIIGRLQEQGIESHWGANQAEIEADTIFEPPCSIKWMDVQHSLELGAFSYGVSGYFFACRIGRYVSIGEAVQFGRGNHPMSFMSTSPAFYLQEPLFRIGDDFEGAAKFRDFRYRLPDGVEPNYVKHINIGNDVWIGHGTFIRPGITIGDGAVIAGQTVVVKDVPPYAIVAGNPGVVKKYRFADHVIEALLHKKWWRFAPWQLGNIDITDPAKFLDQLDCVIEMEKLYSPAKISMWALMAKAAAATES